MDSICFDRLREKSNGIELYWLNPWCCFVLVESMVLFCTG
jgi:hypothetical protein